VDKEKDRGADRGRFRIPARLSDGQAWLVELGENFLAILSDAHWKKLFRTGTSLWTFDGHTAAIRAIDLKAKVYVEPCFGSRKMGVSFESVKEADYSFSSHSPTVS
jgi:hypothetical protein